MLLSKSRAALAVGLSFLCVALACDPGSAEGAEGAEETGTEGGAECNVGYQELPFDFSAVLQNFPVGTDGVEVDFQGQCTVAAVEFVDERLRLELSCPSEDPAAGEAPSARFNVGAVGIPSGVQVGSTVTTRLFRMDHPEVGYLAMYSLVDAGGVVLALDPGSGSPSLPGISVQVLPVCDAWQPCGGGEVSEVAGFDRVTFGGAVTDVSSGSRVDLTDGNGSWRYTLYSRWMLSDCHRADIGTSILVRNP